MGGLLGAEVALLPPYSPTSSQKFRHRILGTINFDCPFLGLHPGVIFSGIGSLFRSTPDMSVPQSPDIRTENLEMRPTPGRNDKFHGSSVSPSVDLEELQSQESLYSDSGTNLTPAISANYCSANSPQSLLSPTVSRDPNYNPPFINDAVSQVRTGWDAAIHFVSKHSDGLTTATKSYVTSHFEFGGCLADYKGLKKRYSRIRLLEDFTTHHPTRIRFVNYYTASTGRLKKTKSAMQINSGLQSCQLQCSKESTEQEMQDMSVSRVEYQSPNVTPRISIEEHHDGNIYPKPHQDLDDPLSTTNDQSLINNLAIPGAFPELNNMEAASVRETNSEEDYKKTSISDTNPIEVVSVADKEREEEDQRASNSMDAAVGIKSGLAEELAAISLNPETEMGISLPPLPPPPKPPSEFRPEIYADKDVRQLAHKEYARQNKDYIRSLKSHAKALKDREKLIQKRVKAAEKAKDKPPKLVKTEKSKVKKDAQRENPQTLQPSTPTPVSQTPLYLDPISPSKPPTTNPEKPPRDKKFCMLPPKLNNQPDPCWVRIYMRGVDEVGAHCGLFFVGEHYKALVSDVGSRIKQWVEER